jgi:hypothetical protein
MSFFCFPAIISDKFSIFVAETLRNRNLDAETALTLDDYFTQDKGKFTK